MSEQRAVWFTESVVQRLEGDMVWIVTGVVCLLGLFLPYLYFADR